MASLVSPPFLYLPALAAAPIAAASTVNAANVYTDGTSLLASINGGAYFALVGSASPTFTGVVTITGTTNAPTLDITTTAVGGNVVQVRHPSATTPTSTLTYLKLDMTTNWVAGNVGHIGIDIRIPATTVASATAVGGINISSQATRQRITSYQIRNLQAAAGGVHYTEYDAVTTSTGDIYGSVFNAQGSAATPLTVGTGFYFSAYTANLPTLQDATALGVHLSGWDATSGATNAAGSNLLLAGGRSTGSAAGGSVVFYTAAAGGGGTSYNLPVARWTLGASGQVTHTPVATSGTDYAVTSPLTSGTVFGATLSATAASSAYGYTYTRTAATAGNFTGGALKIVNTPVNSAFGEGSTTAGLIDIAHTTGNLVNENTCLIYGVYTAASATGTSRGLFLTMTGSPGNTATTNLGQFTWNPTTGQSGTNAIVRVSVTAATNYSSAFSADFTGAGSVAQAGLTLISSTTNTSADSASTFSGVGGGVSTNGLGLLRIFSGFTAARVVDIMCSNTNVSTGAAVINVRWPSAVTAAAGASFTGFSLDMSNITAAAGGGAALYGMALTGSPAGNVNSTAFAVSWSGALGTTNGICKTIYNNAVTTTTAGTIIYNIVASSALTLGAGASLTGINLDLSTNVVSVTTGKQTMGAIVTVGTGTGAAATDPASSSYCATFDYRSSNGTAAGNGIVNITTGSSYTLGVGLPLAFLRIDSNAANLTAGSGGITGVEVDLSTNVVPGANIVYGFNITLPASTGDSTAGAGCLITNNAVNLPSLDLNVKNVSTTNTGNKGIITVRYQSSTTLTGLVFGYYQDLTTNVAANGTRVIGGLFVNPVAAGATSSCLIADHRSTNGTTAGVMLVTVGGSTTLTGALVGTVSDMQTNVVPNGQVVTALSLGIPATPVAGSAAISFMAGTTYAATAPAILGPSDTTLFISAGAATGTSAGRGLTLTAGAASTTGAGGGIAATGGAAAGTTGSNGGGVTFTGGAAATHTTGTAGNAGGFTVVAVTGGAATASLGVAGVGNAFTVSLGGGGANTGAVATGTNGAGGAFSFTSGSGGSDANLTGTSTGGVGGGWTVTLGAGSAQTRNSTTTVVGGGGGGFSLTAGAGGAAGAATTSTGGNGGGWTCIAGAGGATQNSATQTSGNGGGYSFTAGAAGATSGATTGTGGVGGGFTWAAGAGGNSVSVTGGAAGNFTFTGAAGGANATSGIGGAGSGFTFTCGTGGNGATTGGVGGSVLLKLGAAGTGGVPVASSFKVNTSGNFTGLSLTNGAAVGIGSGAGASWVISIGLSDSTMGFFGATAVAQQAIGNNLTDSTTGTPSDTLVDVGAVPTQANINNNFSSCLTKINALYTALKTAGLGLCKV